MEVLKTLKNFIRNEYLLRKVVRSMKKKNSTKVNITIEKSEYCKETDDIEIDIEIGDNVDSEYIDHDKKIIVLKNKKYTTSELMFVLHHEAAHVLFRKMDKEKIKEIYHMINKSGYIEEDICYIFEEAFCDFIAIQKIGWINYLNIIHRSEAIDVLKEFKRTTIIKRFKFIINNIELLNEILLETNFTFNFN